MQTKEQKRSAFAIEQREKISQEEAFWVGLPTMILSNGLGQTIAFLLSKGKDYHHDAVDIILEWLQKEHRLQFQQRTKKEQRIEFIKQLAELDSSRYLQYQQETMDMLCWVKRYAKAFKDKK